MSSIMTAMTTDDVVASARPGASCNVGRYGVSIAEARVIAPVTAVVVGEKSVFGTDVSTLDSSGRVPWSSPV